MVLVAAFHFKLVGQAAVGLHQLRQSGSLHMLHLRLAGADFLFQADQRLLNAQKLVVDGQVGIQGIVLRQVPKGNILSEGDLSLVGGQLPHNDAQESRLAGAVDANDGGLFIILYMEGDAGQNRHLEKAFLDVLTV